MTHETITTPKEGKGLIDKCPGDLEFVAPDIEPLKQANPNDPVIDIDVNKLECGTCGDKKTVTPKAPDYLTDIHL
jgi:hypothetical protein